VFDAGIDPMLMEQDCAIGGAGSADGPRIEENRNGPILQKRFVCVTEKDHVGAGLSAGSAECIQRGVVLHVKVVPVNRQKSDAVHRDDE
jgi:hypothetical protein